MQCCALYKLKKREILFFKECDALETANQRDELKTILVYVNDFSFLKQNEIKKIHASCGVWYLILDARNCCHLLLCQSNYPSASAFRFISQMRRTLTDVHSYDTSPENIQKFAAHRIFNLMKSYHLDPSTQDNIIYSEKSFESITINNQDDPLDLPPEPIMQRDPQSLQASQNKPHTIVEFVYPKPNSSAHFNEFICYGFFFLISFLLVILVILKVA